LGGTAALIQAQYRSPAANSRADTSLFRPLFHRLPHAEILSHQWNAQAFGSCEIPPVAGTKGAEMMPNFFEETAICKR
jgi:hypothetical protein